MLYAKFIRLVEDHAELITQNWLKEVKTNPATPGYRKMSDDLLTRRVFDVYKKLGNWLMDSDPCDTRIAEHYIRLGRERASENRNSSEVTYAFILTRVVAWKFILNQGIIENSFDLQQAFDFYQKVINFYDRAIYFVNIGYESYRTIDDKKISSTEYLDKIVKGVTNWFIK